MSRKPAYNLALKHWRIEGDGTLYKLSFDRQEASVNSLDEEVIEELEQALSALEAGDCKGLVIASAKRGNFIAGADIRRFTGVASERQATTLIAVAHRVFDRLEQLPFPTAALINGHCLGGGLELALACRYRVALDEASLRIGLPEVNLGIHPGFGGSVRLIETGGVPAAMDLMLTGRTVPSARAKQLGIVDLVVPERQLLRAGHHLIHSQPPRRRARSWQRLLTSDPFRPLVARALRKRVASRVEAENYPAPFALIDLWQRHGGDRQNMLRAEGESVARLVTTPTSRNLVRAFFLRDRLKHLGDGAADVPRVQRVHVVGAGVMGGDIAAWCTLRGLRVSLQDTRQEAIARAVKRAQKLFSRLLRKPRLVQGAMDRLQPDPEGTGIRHADLVVEAIFEDLSAKQELFALLEREAPPTAMLATNTSSIPLEAIGEALTEPERLVGLHFFNPVTKMQLVEVVQGTDTPDLAVARAAAFVSHIGRLPVAVKSAPGFLVNRILMPYLLEAVQLLEEQVPGVLIDRAAIHFGMPIGPIELADSVGLDICHHVAENLDGAVPALLQQKVDAGDLGRKSGRGFYLWKQGKAQKPAASRVARAADDLQQRLINRMLNEAVSCLREEIVTDSDLLDAGVLFGTGFAPFRGGPMQFIRETGEDVLLGQLRALEQRYGPRFGPDPGWTMNILDSGSR